MTQAWTTQVHFCRDCAEAFSVLFLARGRASAGVKGQRCADGQFPEGTGDSRHVAGSEAGHGL